jgi:hypothetical protein
MGRIARAQGDYDRATEFLEAGLDLFRALQDRRGIA